MKFVDTNIFLRLLLWDDTLKAEACRKFFKKALEHHEPLCTTSLVIAEIVWVLEKSYRYPRAKVAESVLRILSTDNLQVEGKEILMESLGLYQLKKIDFIDAFNTVTMLEKGIKTICSYDNDFDTIKSIHREEP